MTKINVTAEHIENGKTSDCCLCPLALAIKSVVNDAVIVMVGTTAVTLDGPACGSSPGYHTEYLPTAARFFVSQFDKGFEVSPFSFELYIRPDYLATPNPA